MARKTTVSIDITSMPMATTLVRQVAKQNLTNLNDAYWISERGHALLHRSYAKIRMPIDPNAHGVYGSATQWEEATDVQREWMRRHVIFSAASLLEAYLVSAATTSFWAKPALIDKSLAALQPGCFAKQPKSAPKHFRSLVEAAIKRISKGTWPSRLVGLASIFGVLPPNLLAYQSGLQVLQTRRNRIAHQFGVDGEMPKTPWESTRSVAATPSYINDVLVMVNSVIKVADEDIFGPQIGGYEMLHELQTWSSKQKQLNHLRVVGALPRAFRKHIGDSFGTSPGQEYCIALVKYFDSL